MRSISNRGAVASLVFSRVIYAVNWYNVAAVFAFMAHDFGQDVSGLGFVTASFYIGLGVFQIPGGVFAAKFGPRKIAIYGILISSAATSLTAVTSEFYQFVILRFFVGVGMALFFGPGVTLVAKSFSRKSQGFGVGVFNAAFYVGGALGLFAWSVLADLTGWRLSLAISSALGVLGALFLLAYLPRDELRKGFVIKADDLRKVLSNRWLLILSLYLFGIGSGQILINTFMIFYLEQSLNLGPASAGIIGSLSPLSAIFASPLFGLLYDKTRRIRLLLFSLGSALAIAVALVSIGNSYSAIGATIIVGSCSGAFTISYLAAREVPAVSAEYETLAVSWVNCIQMFAGFWSPVAFSLLAISFGYSISWLIAAVYTLFLISVVLLVRDNESHQ